MGKVSEQLRYFIRYKLQHDQLWRGLRIILSDGSVPGEGEHKIMQAPWLGLGLGLGFRVS